MTHIRQEELDQIKEKLLADKTKIEEELETVAEKKQHGSTVAYEAKFQDIGDTPDENALEVTDYGNRLAVEEVLEKSLRDIKNALERVDEEGYGICKYCQKEIPVQRLLARPESNSCIECKTTLQSGK